MTRIVDECAAIALAGLADDVAARFADDPLGTLRDDLNLTVRAVGHLDDSRADGGVCDGVSYLSDGVVLYRTTGNRRENFTLAHELGHWLVDQADDVYDRLADLDDAAKLLEAVCDQIARLLRTGQGDRQKIISGDDVVIAAGSRPVVPDAIAASGVRFHTNEDIMRLPELPRSMVIIGGGYIAMEFAHVFDALGTDVTIVSRSPLLRHLDSDLRKRFNALAHDRFTILSGRQAIGADEADGSVSVRLDDGSTVTAEVLLVATGRTPNGGLLDLGAGGIDMTASGGVKVDRYGRSTSAPGVWAFGDVSSPYLLKHVANAEMRAVRHNLLHPDDLRPMPHDHVPAAVFTHPQIACVGLTEEEARAAGHDVIVKVQHYGEVAYGWAMEDTTGMVKLIADRATGRLLGAHYLGPQASTLIQQLITVMAFDLDVRDVATGQYWIHPALPEVTENALLGLDFS